MKYVLRLLLSDGWIKKPEASIKKWFENGKLTSVPTPKHDKLSFQGWMYTKSRNNDPFLKQKDDDLEIGMAKFPCWFNEDNEITLIARWGISSIYGREKLETKEINDRVFLKRELPFYDKNKITIGYKKYRVYSELYELIQEFGFTENILRNDAFSVFDRFNYGSGIRSTLDDLYSFDPYCLKNDKQRFFHTTKEVYTHSELVKNSYKTEYRSVYKTVKFERTKDEKQAFLEKVKENYYKYFNKNNTLKVFDSLVNSTEINSEKNAEKLKNELDYNPYIETVEIGINAEYPKEKLSNLTITFETNETEKNKWELFLENDYAKENFIVYIGKEKFYKPKTTNDLKDKGYDYSLDEDEQEDDNSVTDFNDYNETDGYDDEWGYYNIHGEMPPPGWGKKKKSDDDLW